MSYQTPITMFTFEQLRESVIACTGYDLVQRVDEDDEVEYALIDPFGDQDGEAFYDLNDVADFITNNEAVNEYLYSLEVK